MQTALQELETYLNDSSQREKFRSHLEAFGFDGFEDTRRFDDINEYVKEIKCSLESMRRITSHHLNIPPFLVQEVPVIFGVGIINPYSNRNKYQHFSLFTPSFKRIRNSRIDEYSREEIETSFKCISDLFNQRLRTIQIAYSILDKNYILLGTPEFIETPEIDLGDGITILNTQTPPKYPRQKLEELLS